MDGISAGMLLAIGLVLGGIGYGLAIAILADAIRRTRRKRARFAWRQMGGGRL